MKFSDVIGQEEAIGRLRQLVEEQRVPSTMMLCGPSGSGKMALAMAFASYLLGERDGENSLLSDQMAIKNAEAMLKNWEHPDLHFTYPTIKTSDMGSDHTPVSDDFIKEWREMLLKDGAYVLIGEWIQKMGKSDAD